MPQEKKNVSEKNDSKEKTSEEKQASEMKTSEALNRLSKILEFETNVIDEICRIQRVRKF